MLLSNGVIFIIVAINYGNRNKQTGVVYYFEDHLVWTSFLLSITKLLCFSYELKCQAVQPDAIPSFVSQIHFLMVALTV